MTKYAHISLTLINKSYMGDRLVCEFALFRQEGTESYEVNSFPFGQTHVGFAKYPKTLKNSDFYARCARAFFTTFIT